MTNLLASITDDEKLEITAITETLLQTTTKEEWASIMSNLRKTLTYDMLQKVFQYKRKEIVDHSERLANS